MTPKQVERFEQLCASPRNSGYKPTAETYELCPDCDGTLHISRLIRAGDGFFPTQSEIVPCGRCGYTGLVPRE